MGALLALMRSGAAAVVHVHSKTTQHSAHSLFSTAYVTRDLDSKPDRDKGLEVNREIQDSESARCGMKVRPGR